MPESGPDDVFDVGPSKPPRAYARARGKLGQLVRDGASQEQIDAVRSELRGAVAENRVREIVDAAPPLTEIQRARLAALLLGSHRSPVDAEATAR